MVLLHRAREREANLLFQEEIVSHQGTGTGFLATHTSYQFFVERGQMERNNPIRTCRMLSKFSLGTI